MVLAVGHVAACLFELERAIKELEELETSACTEVSCSGKKCQTIKNDPLPIKKLKSLSAHSENDPRLLETRNLEKTSKRKAESIDAMIKRTTPDASCLMYSSSSVSLSN